MNVLTEEVTEIHETQEIVDPPEPLDGREFGTFSFLLLNDYLIKTSHSTMDNLDDDDFSNERLDLT